mmetsp:Transcript_12937/g.23313  ORF Transcript_12937/g.23313 Transcript_12937/m.23313 type:complete len:495 (-) Transcript_12937:90-1574(-)
MTQAFCHVVLHYSIARLSWKTIKSLRRSRSRLRRKKCDGNNITAPTSHTNDEDVSPVEYEILQGWTILAFHSLYVSLGIEYFVRFAIPFYFHMKMMVLIVTFVVPSWAGRNGGGDGTSEFGLSPVISYWFDYLIVPVVHSVHDLMDQDPKGWAMRQLAMVPFWVIDYLVLPGVLATDEEKQLVRKMRSEDRISGVDTSKVPPSEAFPPPIINAINLPSDQCFEPPVMPDEQTILREINDDSQSATKDTDTVRTVSHIQGSSARKSDDSEIIHTTPRSQKTSTLFNESTPNRTHTPLLSRATPTALSSSLTNKKSYSLSLSPAVRSRLASSAMKLKRFSREHRNNGGPASDADGDDGSKSEATKRRTMESPPKKRFDEENETLTSARKPRRRRRERLSLGDHFREIVTGDANIRVRDHLFDLELPSSSPRRPLRTRPDNVLLDEKAKRPGSSSSTRSRTARNRATDEDEQEQMDSPIVTARRSTRLAKKKVSNSC